MFINPEEFLKQSENVQSKLVKLWKCDEGDLFIRKEDFNNNSIYCNVLCINVDMESNVNGDWDCFKTQVIPLFTEGQLRELIEEYTKCVVELLIISYIPELICVFDFHSKITGNTIDPIKTKSVKAENMLEIYWNILIRVLNDEFDLEV